MPDNQHPANTPTPLDRHIAQQIRTRRIAAKLSQVALGEMLGVTFQQVQKYENASNRVAASRLWDIAKGLQCEVGDFFPKVYQEELTDGAHVSGGSLPLASMYEQLTAPSRSVVARLIRALHRSEQG